MDDVPVKQVARVRGTDGKFLLGVGGNPNGRPPRSHCISDLMYELLSGDPEAVLAKWNKAPKKTGAMRVVIAWYKKLTTADMTALKEVLDRVEGKVPQAIEATGKDGESLKPTIVNVISMDAKKATDEVLAGKRTG